jgi:hypothetical protein
MERRALVLALALTLPLALYGVPYAYASQVSTSYTALWHDVVLPNQTVTDVATCTSGDYVTGGGWEGTARIVVYTSEAQPFGPGPSLWKVTAHNIDGGISQQLVIVAVCQTPISVAGIGVPEFGSLYVAIALGAVVYFMLSKRLNRKPTISASINP